MHSSSVLVALCLSTTLVQAQGGCGKHQNPAAVLQTAPFGPAPEAAAQQVPNSPNAPAGAIVPPNPADPLPLVSNITVPFSPAGSNGGGLGGVGGMTEGAPIPSNLTAPPDPNAPISSPATSPVPRAPLVPEGGEKPFDCTTEFFESIAPPALTIYNATNVPDNGSYGKQSNTLYGGLSIELPSLCALHLKYNTAPNVSFDWGLYLPYNWSGRFMGVGNGGFSGSINWQDMGDAAKYGMASASTNTGHTGGPGDTSWSIGHPELQYLWAYQALHNTTVLSKQLIKSTYKVPAKYSYFGSCSTGGRQALSEAQKYPEDYDGVIVGAPAWWMSHTFAWVFKNVIKNLPLDAPHRIPPQLFPVIRDEVEKQCDAHDGVEDGVIQDPFSCKIQTEPLRCKLNDPRMTGNESTTTCMNLRQIATLKNIWTDYYETGDEFVFPALMPGAEDQWIPVYYPNWADPSKKNTSVFTELFNGLSGRKPSGTAGVGNLGAGKGAGKGTLQALGSLLQSRSGQDATKLDIVSQAAGFLRHMADLNPDEDSRFAQVKTQAADDARNPFANPQNAPDKVGLGNAYAALSPMILNAFKTVGTRTGLDADDYDLSAFYKRGGKMIHYHGLADGDYSPRSSVFFHKKVEETMAGTNITDFYRMFMVPGMQHCFDSPRVNAPWYFAGGSQAWRLGLSAHSVPGFENSEHDLLLALQDWVEKDKPIERIIATAFTNETFQGKYNVIRQRPLCMWPQRSTYIGSGDPNLPENWDCSATYVDQPTNVQ
ncbi:hypothetical protein LTS18_003959 [Coniosporium uncinatum]|uniref:Uncharacterized protein n=1 Tax=Coniosporium uncinatum TaxID=93489 RepID=A0ACC3DBB1_9PEZI|nr:hypothetical protein LTS18_003959 [Coniosporium uncinatum]